MIKEAKISNPTGVMYAQEHPYNALSNALARTINVQNPAFSYAGSDQVTGYASQEKPEISSGLLQYRFLSMTTGCELRDVDIVVVVEQISEHITTNYLVAFENKGWMRTRFDPGSEQLSVTINTNSASVQTERLREISGLTIKRIAEVFGVSLTTYHKWISGSPLRDAHREHLLEVLPLIEQAAQRIGNPNATSTWLLTPVSPGGKKPVDYLAEREFALFRGFLLRVRTGQEMFRPLTPSNRIHKERSPEEIESALKRLRPRAWSDDEDIVPSDADDKDGNS
jgi:transcriptional regulator with XRE-family HTH domain